MVWARVYGSAACGNNEASQISASREEDWIDLCGYGIAVVMLSALGVA